MRSTWFLRYIMSTCTRENCVAPLGTRCRPTWSHRSCGRLPQLATNVTRGMAQTEPSADLVLGLEARAERVGAARVGADRHLQEKVKGTS